MVFASLSCSCERHDAGEPGARLAVESLAPDKVSDHEKAIQLLGKLNLTQASPLEATEIFTTMLRANGIDYRLFVFYGGQGIEWYPVVEIRDTDGDHAIDIYGFRYLRDYDESPAPFARMLTAVTLTTMPGRRAQSPPWARITENAFIELGANTVAQYPIRLDFQHTHVHRFEPNSAQASSHAVFLPALAAAGDIADGLGAYTLVQSYRLSGLVPGERYRLNLEGKLADLIHSIEGLELKRNDVSRDSALYIYAATATQATVNLGAEADRRVEFEQIRWERR